MASLDRMALRGVRSFDDKSIAVVRFHTPLTVIQGANGSGKTTIIEGLKYVTTGDMPPNSKGGAFIHDPGMATANEVKAQVRLRFRNTNKVMINAVRNVQVSRKRTGGLTMKTLESLLSVEGEDGQANKRTTLSTKCADMDNEIPALLGVSRAILDNVIFCHQEENNWPLGEPSSLKKKFDEIFESSRYQKAVESIRHTRKELMENNRVAQAELEGLKKDRERAESVKTKLGMLNDELSEKERRLKWLNDELSELTRHNRELNDTAVRFRETVQKAEGLEDKKGMLNESLHALKSSMTVLNESESELQRRRDGFESHLAELKRKQDASKRRIADLKREYKEIESQYNRKLSEKGALESDKRYHERAVRQQQDLVRDISNELGIKGFDGASMSEEKMQDFIDHVDDDLRRMRKDFDAHKAEYAKRESEASQKHQDLRSSFRAKESSRDGLLESIKKFKERVKSVQEEMDGTAVSDSDIENARNEHKELMARLQQLNEELQSARYDDKIREKNTEIRELEERRDELTSELNSLNRQADFRAKLDMNRKAATDKSKECENLLTRHSAALERVIGHKVEVESLEEDVGHAHASREKALAEHERTSTEINNRVQRMEAAAKVSHDQQLLKENTVNKLEERIKEALENEEFTSIEDAITTCQNEVDHARDTISMYESMTSFFINAQKHSKNTHVCLGCNRGLDERELPTVDAYLLDKIEQSKHARQDEYRADLAQWQEQLDKFVELKPIATQLSTLKDGEIAILQKEIASLDAQLQSARKEAEEKGILVEQDKQQIRELSNLKRIAADIVRLSSESKQMQKDAQLIENDLRSTGSIRTGDQVQVEIDSHSDQIKRAKREINTLQMDKDGKRTAIVSHERKVHQAEMTVAQKAQDHQNFVAMQKRSNEIREELADSNARLARIQKDLEESSGPIQRASIDLEKIKRDASRELSQEQEKLNEMNAHYRKLQDSKKAVDSYINQRGPQKLRDCEGTITDLERNMEEIRKGTEKHEADAAAIERDLTESRSTERNIADNLRSMQYQREIEDIDKQLEAMDLEDALQKHRQWDEKYTLSKRKENKLNGDASHMSGEIASLKSQIKGRERELRDDYKHVEKSYVSKLIDVQTSKLAQQDLDTYQKALQAAIMKFHAIKMEEINERLAELWRETYQGSDVDCIMIRADAEGAGNRTHNYRVVMMKDSVELDMRGRCSAGQKCLASILIRLALADSFSENCGIMALDEPTTNLDYDNILSLAESLGQLVKQRRQQSNFQLIVITHDDEFLDKLTRAVGLDEWLRVTRDENNRSVIKRERHTS